MGKVFKEITPGAVEDVRVEYVRISTLVDQKTAELAVLDQEIEQRKSVLVEEKMNFLQHKDVEEKELSDRIAAFEKEKQEFVVAKERQISFAKDNIDTLKSLELREKTCSDFEAALDLREKALTKKESEYRRDSEALVTRTIACSEKEKFLIEREEALAIREETSEKVSRNNVADSENNEVVRRQVEQDRVALKVERESFEKEKQAILELRASINEATRLHQEKVLSSSAALAEIAEKQVKIDKELADLEIEKSNNKAFEQQLKYKEGELINWEKDLALRASLK